MYAAYSKIYETVPCPVPGPAKLGTGTRKH
jgi:hypothetical protein